MAIANKFYNGDKRLQRRYFFLIKSEKNLLYMVKFKIRYQYEIFVLKT